MSAELENICGQEERQYEAYWEGVIRKIILT